MNIGFQNRAMHQKGVSRGAGKTFSMNCLWTFNKYSVKSGEQKHILFLTGIDKAAYLPLHYIPNNRMAVCNAHYRDEQNRALECDECAKPNTKFPDQNNRPIVYLCILGYVFEDAGLTKTSAKGTTYEVNPKQVVMIPANRNGMYLEEIEDANDGDYLTTEIWKFKRSDEGDLCTPALAIRKNLAKNFDFSLAETMQQQYEGKKVGDVLSEIFSPFGNVQYDNHELKTFGIKALENDAEPESKTKGTKSIEALLDE